MRPILVISHLIVQRIGMIVVSSVIGIGNHWTVWIVILVITIGIIAPNAVVLAYTRIDYEFLSEHALRIRLR